MQVDYPSVFVPVATPVKLFEVDSNPHVLQQLQAKVPEKIIKIGLTILKECQGESSPRSFKTKDWDIVAMIKNGKKSLFFTERNAKLTPHVVGFSCKRAFMATIDQDLSVEVKEISRYSQAIISNSKVIQQKRDRMFSVMQRFAGLPCVVTTYAYVQQGSRVRFFQERPEESIASFSHKCDGLEKASVDDKFAILIGLAEAVDTLASAGFTHGSLAPQRIFLSRESGKIVVKLTNFSHASRHKDWEARGWELSNIMFAAPESVRFMCSSDMAIAQNSSLYRKRVVEGVHPLDVEHEVIGTHVKLLPDSAVDVWTLGSIMRLFAAAGMSDIQAVLQNLNRLRHSSNLARDALNLLLKEKRSIVEEKALARLLTMLDENGHQGDIGKLSGSNVQLKQLQKLLILVNPRLTEEVDRFQAELSKLPKAPKELTSLLAISQSCMQFKPEDRLSTKEVLDALVALKMSCLNINKE